MAVERLIAFEPVGLGPFSPRFRRLLAEISDLRQSQIIDALSEEAAAVSDDGGAGCRAFRATLSFSATTSRTVTIRCSPTGHALIRCWIVPLLRQHRSVRTCSAYTSRGAIERSQNGRAGVGSRRPPSAQESGYDSREALAALAVGPPEVELEKRRQHTGRSTTVDSGGWFARRGRWRLRLLLPGVRWPSLSSIHAFRWCRSELASSAT